MCQHLLSGLTLLFVQNSSPLCWGWAAQGFWFVDAADFFNRPHLATSEKRTLSLAEDNIWRCPKERIGTDMGNFERPLDLLALIAALSWAPWVLQDEPTEPGVLQN